MMVASDVATATCMRIAASRPRKPSAASSTGTITMPPPIPKRPASTPATAPVSSMTTTSSSQYSMRSGAQAFRVVLQMLFDERRYEIVAVVVAVVYAQRQRQTAFRTSLLQAHWLQLFFEIRIVGALVDEDLVVRGRIAAATGDFGGIVIKPR